MVKTVVIADTDTGLLVNPKTGTNGETDRFAKLAGRFLSTAKPTAVLNYGFNGAQNLTLSANGTNGTKITLAAQTVNIPGTLTVQDVTLADLMRNEVNAGLQKIAGTTHEITVSYRDASSDSSGTGTVTLGLDSAVTGEIADLRRILNNFFLTDTAFTAGDGLRIENYTLSVRIGNGLKFVDTAESGSDSSPTRTLAVDWGANPGHDPSTPLDALYLRDIATKVVRKLVLEEDRLTIYEVDSASSGG